MYLLCLILFYNINVINTENNEREEWLNTLRYKIQAEVKPPQIIVFNNDVFNDDRELSQETPTITIDTTKMKISDRKFLASSLFNITSAESLYISTYVLSNSSNIAMTISILDFLNQVSSSRPRSKFLLIVPADYAIQTCCEILKIAWSQKYLDFTIIRLSEDSNATILHYNPFNDVFHQENLEDPRAQLFPDKLRNLNGYPLKIPVFDIPTLMNISHDSKTGKIIVHDVLDYPLLQKAAIVLNFSIEFVEVLSSENITLVRAQEATKLALQENHLNVNLLPYAFLFHNPEYSTLQIFSIYGCIKSVAIVPVISLFKLSMPWHILYYIFVVPVIAFFIIYALRVFRVIRRVWKLFEILQVLLGIPVANVKSGMLNEKLFFLIFTFTSFWYSTEFYSNFVDESFVSDEVSFDRYEELRDSGLQIYLEALAYDYVFDERLLAEIKWLREIKARTKRTNDVSKCVERLRMKKDCICLVADWRAEKFMKESTKVDGSRRMKIAKPVFSCMTCRYTFEHTSPFKEKFVRVFTKFQESGLSIMWKDPWERLLNEVNVTRLNESSVDGKSFLFRLCVVLTVGYLICFFVLLVELVLSCNVVSSIFRHSKIF